MKHHLYQIYYGGFKHKLKYRYYCIQCDRIITAPNKSLVIHYKKYDKKSTVLS